MKVILNEQQLGEGVARLAENINRSYHGTPLTIIGIMTGSIVMLADLIRKLQMPLRVGLIQTSSYKQGTQRGELVVNSSMMPDIQDRHVLLVDDIFDTGHTLAEVIEQVRRLQPKSIRSAVLLNKSGRRAVDLIPDFVMFDIPDEFVVGYGLDYCDHFRNLPFVAALESPDMKSVSK